MALWYSRIVSACSRLKWGQGVPRPVWSPGVGQAAPTAMGAQMPALAAPKFDVGSSYRLAPEWGQVGTGTVLCTATSVDQVVPRVWVPVVALVHPSNGGTQQPSVVVLAMVTTKNRRYEVGTASSKGRVTGGCWSAFVCLRWPANCNVLQRQDANILVRSLNKPDCLLELAQSATHPGAVLHIKHGRVLVPCGGQSRC